MKLEVRFDNIDEVKRFYDPSAVEKAVYSTIKQLNSKAATTISKAVRERYPVTAAGIKSALKPRVSTHGGVPVGYLVYLSKRISLRHFATSSPRPRVKTRAGIRYGARVKQYKKTRAAIVPGAFWGKSKDSNVQQIFQRIGTGRLKIRKLTAPAISQMVGGEAPIKALNELIQTESNTMLSHNLDHFLQRRAGLR